MFFLFASIKNSSEFLSAMDNKYPWWCSRRIGPNIIYVDENTDDYYVIICMANAYGGTKQSG